MQLILGGARSGKSRLAEQIAQQLAQPVVYVATAQALDGEMQARIQHHHQQRPEDWGLCEEPIYLAEQLVKLDRPNQTILVDCLTLWVSNLLLAGRDATREVEDVIAALKARRADTILVSNEVGLGIVPDNALARDFRDGAGIVNQKIAAMADRVVFVADGLPLVLKGAL